MVDDHRWLDRVQMRLSRKKTKCPNVQTSLWWKNTLYYFVYYFVTLHLFSLPTLRFGHSKRSISLWLVVVSPLRGVVLLLSV